VGQMLSRIDRDKRPMREGRARSGSQLRQLEMNDLSELERLGDSERPVPETRFGREELDADALLTQCAQREGSLEGRDAPAGDQYPRRHLNHLLQAAFSDDNTPPPHPTRGTRLRSAPACVGCGAGGR
jgi:hypothetical protein